MLGNFPLFERDRSDHCRSLSHLAHHVGFSQEDLQRKAEASVKVSNGKSKEFPTILQRSSGVLPEISTDFPRALKDPQGERHR